MHNHESSIFVLLGGLIPFLLIIIFYMIAVHYSNKKFRKWPYFRTVLFIIGILCIAFSVVGQLAEQAHSSFTSHMYTHLLLGMLGPLLIALAAPMTLVLRTLKVQSARRLSMILKSRYFQTITHPIVASMLNIGGLWVLYTTELYVTMHNSTLVYSLVHLHVLLAGYVFTVSMVYIDPTPHRTSFTMRAVVLVLTMAAHNILSKWLYANPPSGVARSDAEQGGMTMYYGGDLIDLVIVIMLCYEYYRSTRPKLKEKMLPTEYEKPSPNL